MFIGSKILQQFTGSFILLTCSTIVEAVRTFLLYNIGKTSLNTKILVSIAMPMFCVVIAIGLISLGDWVTSCNKDIK